MVVVGLHYRHTDFLIDSLDLVRPSFVSFHIKQPYTLVNAQMLRFNNRSHLSFISLNALIIGRISRSFP